MQENMNPPESSKDFHPRDWVGDRASISKNPTSCRVCETFFWGHRSRNLCRQCDSELRDKQLHVNDYAYAQNRLLKLRRLLLVMLPLSLATWTVIYLIVRACFGK